MPMCWPSQIEAPAYRQHSAQPRRGRQGACDDAGVNWYLTDWSRLMLDWIYWRTDDAGGDFLTPDSGSTLTSRFQVSF